MGLHIRVHFCLGSFCNEISMTEAKNPLSSTLNLNFDVTLLFLFFVGHTVDDGHCKTQKRDHSTGYIVRNLIHGIPGKLKQRKINVDKKRKMEARKYLFVYQIRYYLDK